MPTFPTLSTPPKYPLKMTRDDFSLKSPSEAGYVHARSRFTRQRRRWELSYENVTQTDANLIEAFVTTVGTVDSFTWAHPASGQYTVRFDSPPKQEMTHWSSVYYYSYEIILMEV